MTEQQPNTESVRQTGFTDEQLLTLRGLRVIMKPAAWSCWQEALGEGIEEVEIIVSSIRFDDSGEPVAFGVRRGEMMRTITEQGDPEHTWAQLIAIEPERELLFNAAGTDQWPPLDWPPQQPKGPSGDPYDLPPY